MSRSQIVVAAMLVTALTGCGASSHPKPATTGVTSGKVVVQEFDMTETVVASYNAPTSGFGVQIAESVAAQLGRRGLEAETIPQGSPQNTAPVEGLRVEGRIMRVDGGSRAARYLVGFGAGSAGVAAAGRVVDGNGTTIGEFSASRTASIGVFGGNTVAIVRKCTEAVARDIASMIVTGQYRDPLKDRK